MQLALEIESAAPTLLWAPAAPAVAVAAMLKPGGRLVGLTAGQFCFLDLVAAILERTGPAVLHLSTWSLALAHLLPRGDQRMNRVASHPRNARARLTAAARSPRGRMTAAPAMSSAS